MHCAKVMMMGGTGARVIADTWEMGKLACSPIRTLTSRSDDNSYPMKIVGRKFLNLHENSVDSKNSFDF